MSWKQWAAVIAVVAFIVAAPVDAGHIVSSLLAFGKNSLDSLHLH